MNLENKKPNKNIHEKPLRQHTYYDGFKVLSSDIPLTTSGGNSTG